MADDRHCPTNLCTALRRQRRYPALPVAQAAQSVPVSRPPRREEAPGPNLCGRCEAVCCRLTVTLLPGDDPPHWLVLDQDDGPSSMAKGEDGWCVALDRNSMRCTIYDKRPRLCRTYLMGGRLCHHERKEWAAAHGHPGIPFVWA
ncbi:MAG TPA: YkgJ family cysteine cluster protein [Xanthomonadaceae bacterium]|nr:YkgJ family cysteine cluster protein [Xanthomonadaceae bacterium]